MFKPFDTIEVSFPNLNFHNSNEVPELFRGTLLYCEKSRNTIGLYDNLFMNIKELGQLHRNFEFWSYLGYNAKINTTRLVLTEKIDFGLIKSYNDLPVDIG